MEQNAYFLLFRSIISRFVFLAQFCFCFVSIWLHVSDALTLYSLLLRSFTPSKTYFSRYNSNRNRITNSGYLTQCLLDRALVPHTYAHTHTHSICDAAAAIDGEHAHKISVIYASIISHATDDHFFGYFGRIFQYGSILLLFLCRSLFRCRRLVHC